MTTYVVLLTGDETVWERMTPEEQAAVFGRHEEFSKLLAERGHELTGGEELTPSRTTKWMRKDASGHVAVTDGPYAEAVEQLGAFYLVDSDDLDDLLEICGVLAQEDGAIEVRAVVDHGGGEE